MCTGNAKAAQRQQRQSLKASPSQNMGFAVGLDVLLMHLNTAPKARPFADAGAAEPVRTGTASLSARKRSIGTVWSCYEARRGHIVAR